MNTLDRPLFRQMGGPAQMTPDEAMMAVGEAEAAGAQIGQEYLEGTMQSLDQAESPKEVIDAIRGNQQPLEARYQELAGFVGEEDARQTPETVLALVQPTIMMTEEGAMDTGIAQLMQQMVGDVDMGGTDMGQGVGSLMMAGASEAPAPQNFNQGGAVAYLAVGSDESGTVPAGITGINTLMEAFGSLAKPPSAETVAGYYESLLPMYQKILGEDEEAKRARQAGTFFDIAQAGLNLAAGVDPRSGQSVAGQPFASQLAAAASQLPAQISARDAERRATERTLKATALETAMKQAQGAQDFKQTIGATLAKDLLDPTKFDSEAKLLTMPEGGVKAYNIDTRQGFADYQKALDAGAMPYEKPTADSGKANFRVLTNLETNTREFVDINTPEGQEAVNKASTANAASTTGDVFSINTIATDPGAKTAQAYLINGDNYLSFDGGRTYQDDDGNTVPMPAGAAPLSDTITYQVITTLNKRKKAAMELREALGVAPDATEEEFNTAVISNNAKGGSRNDDGTVNAVALTAQEQADLNSLLNITTEDAMQAALEGTGPFAAFSAFVTNTLGGFGVPFASDLETQSARQALRGIRVLGRSALVVNPRFPVAEMENVAELFPDPDAILRDPESEANKLIELKRLAKGQLYRNLSEMAGGVSSDLIPDIEANNRELRRLLSLLQTVPDQYSTSANQEGVVNALRGALRKN